MQKSLDPLRRRNRELAILNAITRDLNGSVDLRQALSAVLARVAELFDLSTGWIWLLRSSQVLKPLFLWWPKLIPRWCGWSCRSPSTSFMG